MIFAIIGEELGLVGATLVIAAYAAFGWAGLRIALRCRDPFGKALAVGITTLICGQAALNLAAVVGARAADRDPAAPGVVWGHQPRRHARVGRDPP